MKSFPSSLTTGGFNVVPGFTGRRSIIDIAVKSFKDAFKNAWNAAIGGIKSGVSPKGTLPNTDGIPYNAEQDKIGLLINHKQDIDNSIPYGHDFSKLATNVKKKPNAENAFKFDVEALTSFNKYRYKFDNMEQVSTMKDKEGKQLYGTYDSKVAMSVFNPMYGVNISGMAPNVPLFDNQKEDNIYRHIDLTDCSIKKLIELSNASSSELGLARYKYADFMYCKDLGLPNNRLITLRKFATPVGDNIFVDAEKENSGFDMTPDIGRMLCYFDTEDNKLEDIMKYEYNATWDNKFSEIQQQWSKEDDRVSPIGAALNQLMPGYNKAVGNSTSGGENSILGWISAKAGLRNSGEWYKGNAALENYDKNKVYTPLNTIQEMYMYTGKLEFRHEFTLTFRYKMRSYSNVNQKSAFLDLIGNILGTTFTRGSFWGGRNEILGAQPNVEGWRKVNAFVDDKLNDIGGTLEALGLGQMSLSSLLSDIANQMKSGIDAIADAGKALANGGAAAISKNVTEFIKNTGSHWAVAGGIKNMLGRPQLYAFHSLLTGDNTGLWHVTIGNPRNPIAAFGNLIMTNASIQHLGPLGVDDFPTELKVTVTLKHARPRDKVAIEKMYTKGIGAIHQPYGANFETTSNISESVGTRGGQDYWGSTNVQKLKRNCLELA